MQQNINVKTIMPHMNGNHVLQLLNQEKLHHIIAAWMRLDNQTQYALADFTNNYIILYMKQGKEAYAESARRVVLQTKENGMREPIAYTSLELSKVEKRPENKEYLDNLYVVIRVLNQYLTKNETYDENILKKALQVLEWYCQGANARD